MQEPIERQMTCLVFRKWQNYCTFLILVLFWSKVSVHFWAKLYIYLFISLKFNLCKRFLFQKIIEKQMHCKKCQHKKACHILHLFFFFPFFSSVFVFLLPIFVPKIRWFNISYSTPIFWHLIQFLNFLIIICQPSTTF